MPKKKGKKSSKKEETKEENRVEETKKEEKSEGNVDWGFYWARLKEDCGKIFSWVGKKWKKSRNFRIGVIGAGVLAGVLALGKMSGSSVDEISFLAENDVYVIRDDGSGRRNVTNTPDIKEYGTSWSRNGQQLIFNTHGFNTFYIISRNGEKISEITHSRTPNVYPVFSPDGSRIAFLNSFDGNVYTTCADGSELAKAGGICEDPSIRWIDNEYLAFRNLSGDISGGVRTGARVAICRFDGSKQRAISKLPGINASRPGFNRPVRSYSLSGDGSKIIMQVDSSIYAGSIDGRVELLEGLEVGVEYPVLSPDGTEILFVKDGCIYTASFRGSSPKKLTDSRDDHNPLYSPDGSKIAFQRARDIWMMYRNGSGQRNVTNTPNQGKEIISWVQR